jgi:hypothetical protein
VQIADLQQREPVEGGRQRRKADGVVLDLDLRRIAPAAPVKARQHEGYANHRMNRIPVLDVEKIEALAEDLRFVVSLDPESLLGVQASQAPL